jgi:hypothetical protein
MTCAPTWPSEKRAGRSRARRCEGPDRRVPWRVHFFDAKGKLEGKPGNRELAGAFSAKKFLKVYRWITKLTAQGMQVLRTHHTPKPHQRIPSGAPTPHHQTNPSPSLSHLLSFLCLCPLGRAVVQGEGSGRTARCPRWVAQQREGTGFQLSKIMVLI